MFNQYKLYMNSKNETQVSENRKCMFRDSEEKPTAVQQRDTETNAPVGYWKSKQGNISC